MFSYFNLRRPSDFKKVGERENGQALLNQPPSGLVSPPPAATSSLNHSPAGLYDPEVHEAGLPVVRGAAAQEPGVNGHPPLPVAGQTWSTHNPISVTVKNNPHFFSTGDWERGRC